jgi:hypothetical protein
MLEECPECQTGHLIIVDQDWNQDGVYYVVECDRCDYKGLLD